MTPGRIQDLEGAKPVIILFKTIIGAVAALHKQTYKIVCFKNTSRGRLRVDAAATTVGKHDPAKQGRRIILIRRSHMYTEASLDQERCSLKADQQAKSKWVEDQVRQQGHFDDVSSPIINTLDEYMEEDIKIADTGREDHHAPTANIPPSGSGAQPQEPHRRAQQLQTPHQRG
jgi:hypothetical protein